MITFPAKMTILAVGIAMPLRLGMRAPTIIITTVLLRIAPRMIAIPARATTAAGSIQAAVVPIAEEVLIRAAAGVIPAAVAIVEAVAAAVTRGVDRLSDIVCHTS